METKSSNDNTTNSSLFVSIFIMDTISYSDLDAHLLYQMSASKVVFFHFINATYKPGFRTPFFAMIEFPRGMKQKMCICMVYRRRRGSKQDPTLQETRI